ncbi:MAG: imidazole glycerol phosphate synthase subunit HisH [Rhodospirillaceae bacterium]|nr:imidazole glycerol phosphate synthase subunit HisH [Rhodospirillaceae bacterium]
MKTIGIIDTGIGNLGSLSGALEGLGFDPLLLKDASMIDDCENLILPGVGAFAHSILALDASGFRQPLLDYAKAGRPLLGICLGMQILFSEGDEGGSSAGLGLIPGRIRHLSQDNGFPLPHIGWNTVNFTQKHEILCGIKSDIDFYFVHSYCAECEDSHVLATTEYSETFPSIVFHSSVIGAQFHPEKSQRSGLKLLENFCWWNGTC